MEIGDRNAGVNDLFGNIWWIATHTEDVSEEEIQQRANENTVSNCYSKLAVSL